MAKYRKSSFYFLKAVGDDEFCPFKGRREIFSLTKSSFLMDSYSLTFSIHSVYKIKKGTFAVRYESRS